VNDSPTASNGNVNTEENTDYVFTGSDFGYSDIDGDTMSGIVVVSLP